MIGIDESTHLLYEGDSTYGNGVWPTPILTTATLISKQDDWARVPASRHLSDAKLLFREDSFDPVTRVRRGRLYERGDGVATQTWHVPAHPACPSNRNGIRDDGLFHPTLYTYRSVWTLPNDPEFSRQLIVLGSTSAMSVWRLLSAETNAFGEIVLTLRARSTLGALPEVIEDAIPQEGRGEILGLLDRVGNAAFRSGADDVAEACRAAFTVVLREWLRSIGIAAKDLAGKDVGKLLQCLEQDTLNTEFGLIRSVARIVQIFHSRAKPNERERLGTRTISEDDAQMLLQNLGFLLREINWAKA